MNGSHRETVSLIVHLCLQSNRSTGCTVIEMFTGQRPWLELNQLAALYNLGHYKTPPLPENISDVARNFLELCFTMYVYTPTFLTTWLLMLNRVFAFLFSSEPDKRPTASELLAHPFCKPDVNFEFTVCTIAIMTTFLIYTTLIFLCSRTTSRLARSNLLSNGPVPSQAYLIHNSNNLT